MYVRLRIKEIREVKGYTQEFVSRELGIPNTSYRNIENNKYKKCNFVILFKLKKLFDVDSVEDLFYVD